MALIKLSAGSDQYWLLNDIPHQRGQFDISATIGQDVVEIFNLATLKSVARGNYFDFSPDGITPYASTQLLIDDLKSFFFRSVAGGPVGGVASVTGDGVSGTATDVVLTFPTSNEVDNDSLIPGASVTLALNELGVSTSDNATAIGTNATNIGLNTTAIGVNAGNINTNTTAIGTVAGELVTHEADTTNPHDTSVSNLNDVILATPQEGEILAFISGTWQNITSPGFNPTTEGVLTDYNSSQDATISTTNSTAGITYINLNTTGAVIGNPYKFTCSFSISHDATNSNAFIDIKDFGVSVLNQVYTVEPKDTNDRTWVTLQGEILPNALGAGQFQLQLDFGTDDSDDDTTMYFGYLSLQKIN